MNPNSKRGSDTGATHEEVRTSLQQLLRLVAKAVVDRLKRKQKTNGEVE